MNDPDNLFEQVMRLAGKALPESKADWTGVLSEKCPPAPRPVQDGKGSERSAMWPGELEKNLAKYHPGLPVSGTTPLICTYLLRSSEPKTYLVPFLQEAGRLIPVGEPIAVLKNLGWEAEAWTEHHVQRYSTQEKAVVFFSQGRSSLWVVLGLAHPPMGTGDGGSTVYEVYMADGKRATKVARLASSSGFEEDRHMDRSYSFRQDQDGCLVIEAENVRYIRGDPGAGYTKRERLAWNGKGFAMSDKA